jgi:hypothetical protein
MKFRAIFVLAIAFLGALFLLPASPAFASGGPGYPGTQYAACNCTTTHYHKPPEHHNKPKPPVHHHPKPKSCPPARHPKPKPPIHHTKPRKPPVPSCECGTVIYEVRCRGFNELIIVDVITGKIQVYHVV